MMLLLDILLAFLAGCADRFTVHLVAQNDAPVQVVSITPDGNNLLAHIKVKNTTDRAVMDFTVSEAIVRCADARSILREGRSAHAEARTGTLAPGQTWGSRPLMPHEETEVTSLLLDREKLKQLAQGSGKLRVQVGIGYVNFMPENIEPEGAFARTGPPDWRDPRFEQGVPDAPDAAQCK